MLKTWCIGWSLLLLLWQPAAADEQIKTILPGAQLVGEGNLKVMFWKVYQAELFAPEKKWSSRGPFALKLTYARELSSKEIADRSIEQIRKQGFDNELKLADWHAQLQSIVPKVNKNEYLIGMLTTSGVTVFYSNGILLGKVKDALFGQRFFDIWLSKKTSEPKLRKKLLGLK